MKKTLLRLALLALALAPLGAVGVCAARAIDDAKVAPAVDWEDEAQTGGSAFQQTELAR